MATKADERAAEIFIRPVETRTMDFVLVGTSPIILNRMSEKARHELLMPTGRKTSAEKQANLKHDPIAEFQASPYILTDESAPSYLAVMASAVKGAMMTAALDLPGAKKAQIGRLVYVQGEYAPVFGVPKLHMSIVRSADMNRTPDVRTRSIISQWAVLISVRFVVPMLNDQSIANLIAAGGVTAGIGDWRPEKGKGSHGQFRVANTDDEEYLAIRASGSRAAQHQAMENPIPYDSETEYLLEWFKDAVRLSGKATAGMKRRAQ